MKKHITYLLLGLMTCLVSAQAPINQLDSTYQFSFDTTTASWNMQERTRYEYPSTHEKIFVQEDWNQDSIRWEPDRKEIFVVDEENNIEDKIEQRWDASTSSWKNWGRDILEKDEQGRRKRFQDFGWNVDSMDWIIYHQDVRTYSNQGLTYEHLFQEVVCNPCPLQNDYKYVVSLNVNEQEILRYYLRWNLNQQMWDSSSRTLLAYDSLGFRKTRFEMSYDFSSWENKWLTSFYNDGQGNETEEISQEWDDNLNMWINYRRRLRTFDSLGNQTLETYQYWDDDSLSWISSSQYIQTWNGNHQRTSWEAYNMANGAWVKNHRRVWNWNAVGEVESFIRSFKHPTLDQWLENTKIDYYWTALPPNAVADRFENLPCSLPNPMKQGQSYYCDALESNQMYQLRIHTLMGQSLSKQWIRGDEAIRIDNSLPQGLYVISLLKEGKLVYRDKVFLE